MCKETSFCVENRPYLYEMPYCQLAPVSLIIEIFLSNFGRLGTQLSGFLCIFRGFEFFGVDLTICHLLIWSNNETGKILTAKLFFRLYVRVCIFSCTTTYVGSVNNLF